MLNLSATLHGLGSYHERSIVVELSQNAEQHAAGHAQRLHRMTETKDGRGEDDGHCSAARDE